MNIVKRINNKIFREFTNIAGPKRFCNICGTSFRGKFNPIHQYYTDQIKRTGYPYNFKDAETLNYNEYTCPHCESLDRDRLIALYLEKYLNNKSVYRLLDIAPALRLRDYLKSISSIVYRSADLSMKDVDDNVDLMDMNIYPDCSFDIFICSHVLEHVLDDNLAMRELHRILSIKGFGIVLVPIISQLKDIDEDVTITDPDERWKRFGQDDHVRLYSQEGFIERLAGAGFKVSMITINDFSLKEFTLLGLSPKSVLYILNK